MSTTTQQLASLLLEEPVVEWAQRMRDSGASWRGIAMFLATKTDGRVNVTGETIRLWAISGEGKIN